MKSLICLMTLPILGFAYPPRLGDPFSPLGPWTSREELQQRKKELESKIAALSPAAKEAYEAELPKEIREELRSLCGWRKKEESTTEAPASTTESVQETTQTVDITTTAQPIIEEKTKEVEFAAFLDVSMPEELNNEAQCSYYA
ncbi:unnamed protein product [Strongylus vulgaris]|uniref:Uncharacterized protein n=1 Tax=Strongylus vulgaris TaxID=40348 RepID=A0A3P7IVZ2_STRVU|nr:unnamed protein product [Strongylus vulgaris]